MKNALLTTGAMLALVSAAPADETFRCGRWIVDSEMPLGEFTKKCGEPSSKKIRTEPIRARNGNTGMSVKVGESTIETWTYDRGTQAAPMVVTIVDGEIKSIERKR